MIGYGQESQKRLMWLWPGISNKETPDSSFWKLNIGDPESLWKWFWSLWGMQYIRTPLLFLFCFFFEVMGGLFIGHTMLIVFIISDHKCRIPAFVQSSIMGKNKALQYQSNFLCLQGIKQGICYGSVSLNRLVSLLENLLRTSGKLYSLCPYYASLFTLVVVGPKQ